MSRHAPRHGFADPPLIHKKISCRDYAGGCTNIYFLSYKQATCRR